jgi:hypothetical protein
MKMAGRIVTMSQIKAAIDAYCDRNKTTTCLEVSDNGKKQYRLADDGQPEDKDIFLWEEGGKLKCSNPEFGLIFSEYLEDPTMPACEQCPPKVPPRESLPVQPKTAPTQSEKPVTKLSGGFRRAERKKAKLRLGITGPAGSGKTMGALLIAGGLVNSDWSKVGIVDTENGSGDLYVHSKASGSEIGEYNIMSLEPPFEATKFTSAIKMAEDAGLEVVILDSITHAWAGEGGFLDKQGKIADKSGNSWTAWRTVTPEHNRFIDAMLQSKIHVIATMRSKTEHVYEGGKVKKLGMAPVAREGMEYEFSVVFDMDQGHNATPTKDRTSLFDGKIFRPTPDTGKMLLKWLEVA